MTAASSNTSRGPIVLSIGYEGRDQRALIEELISHGVQFLLDVRLTPLSRKRGLSKRALSQALGESGIKYIHLRDLGNPKENRAPFHSGDTTHGISEFQRIMHSPAGRIALDEAVSLARTQRIAILCFERSHRKCHRQVIVDEVSRDSMAPVVLA